MFSQSFEGTKLIAIILSLLETAKRHGLNSEKYISYLLDHLPNEEALANKAVLEAYLPWDKTIQKTANRKAFQSMTLEGFSIYFDNW